jgi:mono/diheme cytochrome c family protein
MREALERQLGAVTMTLRALTLIVVFGLQALPAFAAANVAAGRDLVLKSCTSCHAPNGTNKATDGAPPLSYLAKDNKARPAWVRGWLMAPHPPMPTIVLNRAQIDNIIAYLNSLPMD